MSQTPDTDLNEHVRRRYGQKECALMMEKMRHGMVVPKLSNEECMDLMWSVLADPSLHQNASEGFKKVGQSIDLDGAEDALICREAAGYWHEETTDHYATMRQKLDAELAAVAEEYSSGGLTWCLRDVQRLICPYPCHRKVDKILNNVGDDYYRDEIENLKDVSDEDEADSGDEEKEFDAAVAGAFPPEPLVETRELDTAVAGTITPQSRHTTELSASQAEALHQVRISVAALQSSLESLKGTGNVRGVQVLEGELRKDRRRERELVKESPAVAETFLRLRQAEAEEFQQKKLHDTQMAQRRQEEIAAVAARNAAVAELERTKRKIQELESARACKYAVKTFTLDALGAGTAKAGGAKAKKNRLEVLDRMARLGSGLSEAQKNDFAWWKEAWDDAMVTQHGAHWAETFAGWIQNILDATSSTAFSEFMYGETVRVLQDSKALAVPGS